MSFIAWIVLGLIAGFIASKLVNKTGEGMLMDIILGIVGAVVGGFLFSLILGAPSEPFSLTENAWHGWIVSILGAVLVLWAYGALYPRRWWQ